MNILENIMSMFAQNSSTNSNNVFAPNMSNSTNYPESFFTNSYIQANANNQNLLNNNHQTGGILGGLLGSDIIKKIIPLLTQKGKKINITDLMGNINPDISQIFSALSSLGGSKNRESTKKFEQNETIIDISDYTEVS